MTFTDNSDKVKRSLNERANRALVKSAELIKGSIVKNAPVDTSGLKNSIDYQKTIDGKKSRVEIGSTMSYAKYVEYGTGEFAENGAGRKGGWRFRDDQGNWWFTHGQKPTRFMRKAFEANEKKVNGIIENEMKGL